MCENLSRGTYVLYYLLSPKGKHELSLASPGGAGRNRTLNQEQFMKIKLPLPRLNEQLRVVGLIKGGEKECKLLQTKLAALKSQKKGLMQQLLTGKVRVKVDSEESHEAISIDKQ